MSLSLIVVLVTIMLAAWLLRHLVKLNGTMDGSLRILGGISLGGRERVVLIQVGTQQILLGVAPGAVCTLHILEQPVPVAPPTNFALTLRAKLGERKS